MELCCNSEDDDDVDGDNDDDDDDTVCSFRDVTNIVLLIKVESVDFKAWFHLYVFINSDTLGFCAVVVSVVAS